MVSDRHFAEDLTMRGDGGHNLIIDKNFYGSREEEIEIKIELALLEDLRLRETLFARSAARSPRAARPGTLRKNGCLEISLS